MASGRSMEESLLKAVRSLEAGVTHIWLKKFDHTPTEELLALIKNPTDERLYAIGELLRRDEDPARICDITKIDYFFISKIRRIIDFEKEVRENIGDLKTLRAAKRMGMSDGYIRKWWGMNELEIYALRRQNGILPVYKMIDTCAGEFESYIPYFYSSYESENESVVTEKNRSWCWAQGRSVLGRVLSLTTQPFTRSGRSGKLGMKPL